MFSKKHKTCALMLSLILAGSTGCWGDNILSAAAKVASGQISQLTAGEIQVLNQTAIDLLSSETNVQIEPLTTEQAAALSTFFAANNLNTLEDFETLSQTAQNNPDSLQGLEELSQAFAGTDTNIDPNEVDPDELSELFGNIFAANGGGTNNAGQQPQQGQQL